MNTRVILRAFAITTWLLIILWTVALTLIHGRVEWPWALVCLGYSAICIFLASKV